MAQDNMQLSVPSSPRRLGGPGLAALNACTVHEQFKAALAAAPPARGSRGTSSMPLQPALPASPFSQTELQAQQHAAQPSPPKSPTPAVAELMRTLTLSDMALSGSPPSSGAASAAAAPPALGITPACAESLAPWSCSSQLALAPAPAACPADGPGPAAELELRAMQLRARLQEQAQRAQRAHRGMPAPLLQQGAPLPASSASLRCSAAEIGCLDGGAFPEGSPLALDASAGWGQQQRPMQQLHPALAPLLHPGCQPIPSAGFQASNLDPAASLGSLLGAECSKLPLLQCQEAGGALQLPFASLAGAHVAQQAQQAALHTATHALLMQQLPAHLQARALLLQQQQLLQVQLQSATAGLGQRVAHEARRAQHMQHSQQRQASQLARQPEQDPPESLLGIGGRYQPYCQQVITPRLNEAATCALAAVKLLQAGDAPAAQLATGKRFFCSLKEVAKVVPAAKCLVVAPDVRVSPTAHINPVAALQRILRAAEASSVPVVFALSRRGIGQVFGRDKSMSIVAIMHLEGLEDHFNVMVQEAIKGRQLFRQYCGAAAPAATLHAGPFAPAITHHAATNAPASACCAPLDAGSFNAAATALLQQGLSGLQPSMPILLV